MIALPTSATRRRAPRSRRVAQRDEARLLGAAARDGEAARRAPRVRHARRAPRPRPERRRLAASASLRACSARKRGRRDRRRLVHQVARPEHLGARWLARRRAAARLAAGGGMRLADAASRLLDPRAPRARSGSDRSGSRRGESPRRRPPSRSVRHRAAARGRPRRAARRWRSASCRPRAPARRQASEPRIASPRPSSATRPAIALVDEQVLARGRGTRPPRARRASAAPGARPSGWSRACADRALGDRHQQQVGPRRTRAAAHRAHRRQRRPAEPRGIRRSSWPGRT